MQAGVARRNASVHPKRITPKPPKTRGTLELTRALARPSGRREQRTRRGIKAKLGAATVQDHESAILENGTASYTIELVPRASGLIADDDIGLGP